MKNKNARDWALRIGLWLLAIVLLSIKIKLDQGHW